MKHKVDAIKKANKIIELHSSKGLSHRQSVEASIVTFEYLMKFGNPPSTSIHQRVLNYLIFVNEQIINQKLFRKIEIENAQDILY